MPEKGLRPGKVSPRSTRASATLHAAWSSCSSGRSSAHDARAAAQDVLRRVALWERVKDLPEGLDTPLSPRGPELSAGESMAAAADRFDPGLLDRHPLHVSGSELDRSLRSRG